VKATLISTFFLLVIASICVQAPSVRCETVSGETRGIPLLPDLAEGLPIGLVYVHLETSTGDPARDNDLIQLVLREAGQASVSEGGRFNRFFAELAVKRIGGVSGVEAVRYGVYQADKAVDRTVVVFFVKPLAGREGSKGKHAGMLPSGDYRDFPLIYESERAKLTFILNGGIGGYSDTNPFFGHSDIFLANNPIANNPAGRSTTALMEAYVEPGIGGIAQLGNSPLYPYGALTYMTTWSSGQDIYTSGSRTWGDVEKAYLGFIYDLPGKRNVLNVSYGKQDYQLRDGFLIATIPGSNDLAHRAALNLGPRNAYDTAGVARLGLGDLSLEGIVLEPDELNTTTTDTRLTGANVQYNFPVGIEAAFSYLYVPRSDKAYILPGGSRLTREGLRTFNPALTINQFFGVDGLWIKGEYAYQNNENFEMSAYAWYVWAGYRAETFPWRPGVSYRYSFFSGDNPGTTTYERFDPLFSGRSNYFLPGLISSKVLLNSNLRTQRATFSVYPTKTLEILLEYFNHTAVRLNNLGGIGPLQTLSSLSLMQELQLNAFWYIGKNFYFQGIATIGIPGKAIKDAVGGTAQNWYALQGSLYFFF
jgi:hypothetical protein